MRHRRVPVAVTVALAVAGALAFATRPAAQQAKPVAPQKIDAEYTAKIREALQDPRITTELVDHLPASDTVPSPLKFLGRYVGQPGELTYAKDIHRYYEQLAKVSPRARFWKIGTTEEGRDLVALAIADEPTIKSLEKYRDQLAALTDPRRTTDQQAQALLKTAKPIYYITSGIHSPENGGPEMLIELAYRLIVEETPFIQAIRNNLITIITPVIEVDGREKQVDTYYFNKTRAPGDARLPLMYWGKYVQHDNNRDGMGQFLQLTKTVTRMQLEWKPTIMHDLHEAQTYLYSSTGTGPYNDALDPITISEWWLLAQTDVMEMAKRGVPGVFTYGFYDGWVPNYMFFIAHSHNSTGRFYEVQSYGPDNYTARAGATTTSKEWFRPNPPFPEIKWGPRNNTNIQESALLLSLKYVADHRGTFVENYWLKNKRSVEKGRSGPVYGWHIPANQRRKADTADAVNELLRQGLEIHRATGAFKAGNVNVAAGDYVVRADQPYRTLADMYFSIQNYPPQNPRPYDDTGWTFQYMRDLTITEVKDASVLAQAMTPVTGPVKAAGGIDPSTPLGAGPSTPLGAGGARETLIVEHTADNTLVTFRFRNPNVKMSAAEEDFEAAGHRFRAGAIIVANADRAALEPQLKDLGLSAWAVAAAPSVKTHDLDIPRIGYVHSWTRTQDEGWVRAALDTFGVPYTYFADQKLREGNLRAKYDVLIFPHVGGTPTSQVNGMAVTGKTPLPYRKTDKTPNLAYVDSSDDIRGGMGLEGLLNLVKFVQDGGTLITEGSTATILPQYGVTAGITVESPAQLFVRGSILRGKIADPKSPLAYGFDANDLPVYFNQDPVLSVSAGAPGGFGGFGGGGGPANAGLGQNVTPNAQPLRIQPLEATPPAERGAGAPPADEMAQLRAMAAQFGITFDDARPRVVVSFSPNANDLLLSGTIAGAAALTGKAALVDAAVGKGHVVMFALRPFWRWQTQGTYSLGFNAIMNWNDLDAGKTERPASTAAR